MRLHRCRNAGAPKVLSYIQYSRLRTVRPQPGGPDKGDEVFSGHEDSLAGFVSFVWKLATIRHPTAGDSFDIMHEMMLLASPACIERRKYFSEKKLYYSDLSRLRYSLQLSEGQCMPDGLIYDEDNM